MGYWDLVIVGGEGDRIKVGLVVVVRFMRIWRWWGLGDRLLRK